MANSTILSADRETELRKPIDEYVGNIQAQIDALRMDGTDKVVNIQNDLDNLNVTASTPPRKRRSARPSSRPIWKRPGPLKRRTRHRLPS